MFYLKQCNRNELEFSRDDGLIVLKNESGPQSE